MTPESDKLDKDRVNYCIESSEWFSSLVDDDPNGDWRSAISEHAIKTGIQLDSRSPMQIGAPAIKDASKTQ